MARGSYPPPPRYRSRRRNRSAASFVVLAIVGVIALGAVGFKAFQGGTPTTASTPVVQVNPRTNATTATVIPPSPTPVRVRVPIRGGRYTEAIVGGVPVAINPLLPNTDPNVTNLIFSGLTKLDGQGNVYGDLADKIDLDPEGKIYTFHIRDNATWHDGQPVTPDDVLFTIRLMQDPNYPGDQAQADLWRTVTADLPGGNQVRFTLKDRYAPFIGLTTLGILPKHLLGGIKAEELADQPFNLAPIGTGPYRFVNLDRAAPAVTLTLYPQHYEVKTEAAYYIQELRFQYYPSFDVALEAAKQSKASGVQGIAEVPIASLDATGAALNTKGQNWKFYGYDIAAYDALFFNNQSPLFSDRAVRQAVGYAVDREGIAKAILHNGDAGHAGDGPILPTSWAYKDERAKHPYDPNQAKQALDGAGWKSKGANLPREKDGQKLTFTLLTNGTGVRPQVAQMVADQLRAVGFDVQVNKVPLSAFDLQRTYLETRNYDAVIFGYKDLLSDPDPYPLWHSTQASNGYNFTDFRDSDADRLLEDGRRATNPMERKLLYGQFQDLFASESPAVVLYYPRYVVAVSDAVQGITPDTIDQVGDRFRNIGHWFLMYDEKTSAQATMDTQPLAPNSTPNVPPSPAALPSAAMGTAGGGTPQPGGTRPATGSAPAANATPTATRRP